MLNLNIIPSANDSKRNDIVAKSGRYLYLFSGLKLANLNVVYNT